MTADVTAEIHGFSHPDATPTPWAVGLQHVTDADTFWLSTVRPDGRPHVTPLIAVWLDGALYFSTGEGERKAGEVQVRDMQSRQTRRIAEAELASELKRLLR